MKSKVVDLGTGPTAREGYDSLLRSPAPSIAGYGPVMVSVDDVSTPV